MDFDMSFNNVGKDLGIHYPIKKEILNKIYSGQRPSIAPFIRDLLQTVSSFPLVWDPKNQRRKNWIGPIWNKIEDTLRNGRWGGFGVFTLIDNAAEIFFDQRHQFYCEYIEFYQHVEGTSIKEFKFLEKNAPTTTDELFKIVLEERFMYPQFSPLMKPEVANSVQDDYSDSDWSDIEDEKEYWRTMDKENDKQDVEQATEKDAVEETELFREEPDYDGLEENYFESTILPTVEIAGKKLIGYGRIVAGTVRMILEHDEPRRNEDQTATRLIEMDFLNSNGKKIGATEEASTSAVKDTSVIRIQPQASYPFPKTIEKKHGLLGLEYYVNNWNKTISMDNPMEWKTLPEHWEQCLTSNKEVFYYNCATGLSQYKRPSQNEENSVQYEEEAAEQASEDEPEVYEEVAPIEIKFAKSIEQRTSRKGHIYYVNHHNNTSSLQNPMEWKELPEGWRQKLSSDRRVYYYNTVTSISQWERPTEDSDRDFTNTFIM